MFILECQSSRLDNHQGVAIPVRRRINFRLVVWICVPVVVIVLIPDAMPRAEQLIS